MPFRAFFSQFPNIFSLLYKERCNVPLSASNSVNTPNTHDPISALAVGEAPNQYSLVSRKAGSSTREHVSCSKRPFLPFGTFNFPDLQIANEKF